MYLSIAFTSGPELAMHEHFPLVGYIVRGVIQPGIGHGKLHIKILAYSIIMCRDYAMIVP